MADAYGTIVVSGDYTGNIDRMIDVLNDLNLSADGAEFVKCEDRIWLGTFQVQYPTVFPDRDGMDFQDGRRVFFDEASKSLVQEWESEEGKLYSEHYNLEALSKMFTPFLKSGSLELVASANEKARYTYFERLIIRSDGHAERHSSVSHSEGDGTLSKSEYFDPLEVKRAA